MAVSIITQKPLYNQLPVGSEIIFTVSNDTAVANETKVKFCVDIYISSGAIASTSQTVNLKGTFKTTPNNRGVGMFDLSNILANYVKAENMANTYSDYKGTGTTDVNRHPMHLIDKFSMQKKTVNYLALQFYVEYADATTGIVAADTQTEVDSESYTFFNAYLKHTDILTSNQVGSSTTNVGDFGFSLSKYMPVALAGASTKNYLTNAPTTQYANPGDYGTLAINTPNAITGESFDEIVITYYDDSGSISSPDTVVRNQTNGAYGTWNSTARHLMVFFGCYPGNLENWSANYTAAVAAGLTYYTIVAQDNSVSPKRCLRTMTIRLTCPTEKGYEPIRLAWLNQWGAWDYYTFSKKSIRTTSTQGTTYTQLAGTWGSNRYKLDSHLGGKKAFRVNATEKIRVNTDFVSEDFNEMFEELTNSPEVYLLEGFQSDKLYSALNQYVTPVRLTTSNFTRKTSANDNLIQYTFEIEKSKTLRTQSV